MNNKSLVLLRQSIRKFKSEQISDLKIEKLLRAAMQAPSAHNQQPWEFIIIDDKKLILELANISSSFRALLSAPLAIIPLIKPVDIYPDYIIEDLSAATQNILLEATNIGLGSVWIGVYPRKQRVQQVTKIINIKKPLKPFSIIALGLPDEKKEFKSRYDKSRIYYNKME